MNKRILIIFLTTIILSVFVLSACDVFTQQETAEPTTTPVKENADDIHEISFGMWEMYESQNDAAKYIVSCIEDEFKIKIKPMTFTKENYKEEMDWMISANMLPDVFAHDVISNKMQYRVLITSGLIQPVSKNIWAQKENLSRVMSWYEKIYSYKGEMYFIPRTYQTFDQTHGASNVIFYRSDWASNLMDKSFQDTAKFTDIVSLFEAYRASDTDDNTIWDTWGITGSGGLDFIRDMFLTPFGVREWVKQDGEWIPGIISDEAKVAISWAAQLYRTGVIDPDITKQTMDEALNKLYTGKAGAALAPAYYADLLDFEDGWTEHNPDRSITSVIKIMPCYTTPDGQVHNGIETFEGGTMLASRLSEVKTEKVLSLFDYLYTADGRNLFEKGTGELPGQTYIDSCPEFAAFKNLASWNLDKNPSDQKEDSAFVQYASAVLENNIWPWSFEEEMFTQGMITPEMCIIDLDTVAEEKILHIITTTRDFDADWELYVSSMYDELNLDEAINEVNDYAANYFSGQ